MKPVKKHEWSPKKRQCVLALLDTGRVAIEEIIAYTKVPKSTIYDIKRRGTAFSKPRIGRPQVLSATDKRRLRRYITKSHKNRRATPDTIKKVLDFTCSDATLISALHELGFHRRIARRRPALNQAAKKKRLEYARLVRHMGLDYWKRVIFTDEMSVKVNMARKTRDWIWRMPGEEFHPDCVDYRKRETGTGMMFWGAFRWGKMGPGLFFELEGSQKVNSTIYRDQILNGPLKTFWLTSKKKVRVPIVMEDNAPVHKGVCIPVRTKLKMATLAHPPNSPDLNPIEHIWAHMKQRIAEEFGHITSQQEMKRIVQEMWDAFDDNQFNALIESMPARIEAVIKAKGGATKY
jgi:transposase